MWLFPLNWFLSDVEELDLGVAKIRRLDNQDLEAMGAAAKQYRLVGTAFATPGASEWNDFRDREFPWIFQINSPGGKFTDIEALSRFIRRSVEAAIRIVSHRYVSASPPVIFQPHIEDSLAGQYVLMRSDFPDVPLRLKYRLAKEHVPLLQRVHTAALDTNDGRVRVAIRRFLLGYGRGDDDSLIDLWIGLEALFGDHGGEITYKIAMRIANYAGHGSQLFRDLQASYKMRSALVHGDYPANTRLARETARNALRFSLLKILNEGDPPDLQSLDNSIAASAIR